MRDHALVLINGPQPGTTIELPTGGEPITIGRDASRELPLDDQLASRLHARIWHQSGCWHIEDCGSRNGTFVNGRAIERAVLEVGDLIRIGGRLLVFTSLSDARSPFSLRPSQIAATTFALRVREPEKREAMVEQLRLESPQRPIRDAALLCRLATGLHRCQDTAGLVRLVVEVLAQGTGAQNVNVWLVGVDGRLRRANPTAESGSAAAGSRDEPTHLLASLALENDEAMLIADNGDPSCNKTEVHESSAVDRGTSCNAPDDKPRNTAVEEPGSTDAVGGRWLAVPIPGRQNRRGAIECRRDAEEPPFAANDLDFAIAVAHQAGMALENLEHRERLEQANALLRQRLQQQTRIIGQSAALKQLHDRMARVAETDSTVLILGETGTGKELVAQSLHELSPRRSGPYVAVNCAAFSESLLESELFGHEPGSFTGADRRRIGQFERAHRGTIFLDEVGEMSAACQAKLLRVLEGQPFERLGGSEPLQVDVRIVAATHRDLLTMVREKQFREDLYYRLRVIELQVPPLRERGDDVLLLAATFLEHFRQQIGRGPRRLSQAAARAILDYRWPGNVRELKNAMERAVVLGEGETVEPEHLGLPDAGDGNHAPRRLISLAEAQRRHIRYVLEQVNGNKTQACKILGIGRATLYKRLEADAEAIDPLDPSAADDD